MRKHLHALLLLTLAVTFVTACDTGKEACALKRVKPEKVGMSSEILSQIGRAASLAIEEGDIPGCVVAVVKGDKLVFLEAYGNKQVYPDTVAMTTNTIFDLASVSKCVGTTLSFMQLVENGRCRLTDNADMYIDGFKPWTDSETGKTDDITIQDLMTHSSGLSAYISMGPYEKRFGADTPDSLMRVIATETTRHFKPGTDYLYSCLNFVTLQNILQKITGEDLCDYAQKHVFDVLGLRHTCYRPAETRPDLMPLVAPTEVQEDGSVLRGYVHDPLARIANSGNSGNAGVFSNCEDLAVICAAIMNGGETGGKRILSPLAVNTMASVPSDNSPSVGRALGWDNHGPGAGLRGDLFSREHTLCHTGYTGTSIVMDLDAKVAVIVLAHRVHPSDSGSAAVLRARISNIVAGAIQ